MGEFKSKLSKKERQKGLEAMEKIVFASIDKEIEIAKKSGIELTREGQLKNWKNMIEIAKKS